MSMLNADKLRLSQTACGKADFVFLLDESGSVGAVDFETAKTFVKNVAKSFTVGPNDIQIGLDTFASYPRRHFKLNQYTTSAEIQTAIETIDYAGSSTSTADALAFMVNDSFSAASGAREGVTKIAVVITDGKSNNIAATRTQAKLARDAGITILAVGVGSNVDDTELNDIASDPDSQYVFKTDSFDALKTIQDVLAKTACEVSQTACGKADFVFLLDESVSVGAVDFETAKIFVKNVAKSFTVGPNDIQIGLDTFASDPRRHFNLNQYTTSAEIQTAIDAIDYAGSAIASARRRGRGKESPRSQSSSRTECRTTKRRRGRITILAVGVGSNVDETELNDIASDPDSQYVFKADSFNALKTIQDVLAKTACEETRECGHAALQNAVTGRMLNGRPNGRCEWPWMVSMRTQTNSEAASSSAGTRSSLQQRVRRVLIHLRMKDTWGHNKKSIARMTTICSNTSHATSPHRPDKSANSVLGDSIPLLLWCIFQFSKSNEDNERDAGKHLSFKLAPVRLKYIISGT
ncbi:collagen alpha-4(VI) chain-like [Gigantopelta aegis]|uniref:collagen alpha-4(VI) chain-like n=1 Tax=Gigantopelta aegis TaxID=1735272 RepID=UPI001B88E168|nr:collagen alpha-4(VI) chain-like [Gigantopelta aegis]